MYKAVHKVTLIYSQDDSYRCRHLQNYDGMPLFGWEGPPDCSTQ